VELNVRQRVRTAIDDNGIAELVMDDARNANSFCREFLDELEKGLEKIRCREPKVLILRGRRDVFSTGASKQDLIELCDGRLSARDLTLSERILDLPFPTIAAMEGHAVGGGLVLALCCDLVVAACESRYGATFMAIGITPGMGCTALLAEMVGPFLAAEMMLTARHVRGSELAERRANINRIVPRSQVLPEARDLALQIAEKSKEALWMLKGTLAVRKKQLLAGARAQEDLMHRVCVAAPETRKAVEEWFSAFPSSSGVDSPDRSSGKEGRHERK
jgi:polyketide biosynthesis enoyl-CoA hydratase PksI